MELEEPSRASSHSDSEPEEDKSEDEKDPEVDFEGNTIQEAQDKIMSELTRLKDAE